MHGAEPCRSKGEVAIWMCVAARVDAAVHRFIGVDTNEQTTLFTDSGARCYYDRDRLTSMPLSERRHCSRSRTTWRTGHRQPGVHRAARANTSVARGSTGVISSAASGRVVAAQRRSGSRRWRVCRGISRSYANEWHAATRVAHVGDRCRMPRAKVCQGRTRCRMAAPLMRARGAVRADGRWRVSHRRDGSARRREHVHRSSSGRGVTSRTTTWTRPAPTTRTASTTGSTRGTRTAPTTGSTHGTNNTQHR